MKVMDEEGPEAVFGSGRQLFFQYRVPLLLGCGAVIAIGLSSILLVKSTQTTTPIEFSQGDIAGSSSSATLVSVDVQGAVGRPGVYALPVGSRVEDAFVAAGGLAADADSARIAKTLNRAAKLVDGGKIYVFRVGEDVSSHNSDPLLRRSDGSSQNGAVSVNFASQSELESLPGIGPVTAQKIISGRPYQTLDELVAKKAMGQSLLNKLRDQLSL